MNQNHGHIRAFARCPHCGHEAVFEPLGPHDVLIAQNIVCGQRKCPNPNCSGHLFVTFHKAMLVASYPPLKLDFNSENVPERIRQTFEESLTCHSNGAHVASAMMVRRTLEEICEDKGATGKNLKERIKDLESKIVLPQELLEAMDELRLLGNDAAHIEAKDFDQISDVELEVAIELTKEIMKGLYQYSSLLGKLRSLKKA
jgi:hypothetical protein